MFIAELLAHTHPRPIPHVSICKKLVTEGIQVTHKKGYLHVSESPVLHGEVSWEVVCEVVGITSWVGCAHWAYHLLEHARVRVLLGHMISKPRLRESNLTTQGTREGRSLLCAMIFATKEEICCNKGSGENTSVCLIKVANMPPPNLCSFLTLHLKGIFKEI